MHLPSTCKSIPIIVKSRRRGDYIALSSLSIGEKSSKCRCNYKWLTDVKLSKDPSTLRRRNLKTHEIFSDTTPEKFENTTIIDHFGKAGVYKSLGCEKGFWKAPFSWRVSVDVRPKVRNKVKFLPPGEDIRLQRTALCNYWRIHFNIMKQSLHIIIILTLRLWIYMLLVN